MNTSNLHVVVLAGGIWQGEMVRFYKEKGHPVSVVNPNQTPVTELADIYIKSDPVSDVEDTYHQIRDRIGRPAIIASDQSDVTSASVAILSNKFGIDGNSVDSVLRFSTRKGAMYSLAKRLTIPVAKHQEFSEPAQVQEFFEQLGGDPIIVKPNDSTNSRGFRVITRLDEIKDAFNHARKFSPSRIVLAQKYIESDVQVTVEGFCQGGKHISLIASSKGPYWEPSLTSNLRWPADNVPDEMLKRVYEINDLFVTNSGLKFGITHAEYMLNTGNGQIYLNEIACRGGGFRIGREIIKLATGFDTYEQLYSIQMNDPRPLVPPPGPMRGVILQFYSAQEMESVSPWKVSQIQKIPGVFDFGYNFNRNAYVDDPLNMRHSYAICEADTLSACDSVRREVAHFLRYK